MDHKPEDYELEAFASPSTESRAIWFVLLVVILATLLLIWCVSQALAHEHNGIVYSPECCNSAATAPTGDCAPIDDRYVTEEADGYHLSLPAGAHPKLKTKAFQTVIPYKDRSIRQPLDQNYHLCISNEPSNYLYCFMPKPGAV